MSSYISSASLPVQRQITYVHIVPIKFNKKSLIAKCDRGEKEE